MAIRRKKLYDLIYALAASDGRDAALFGRGALAAREAFARGLCGNAFPELWFELPLAGDAWFDVHMLVSRKNMHGDEAFTGLGGIYAEALVWFARSQDTRQLALSFDSSTGNTSCPAVQLLLNTKSLSATRGFLTAAGREDLVNGYSSFVNRMPKEWYACYSGVFPARPDAEWVRVECIVDEVTQRAYANDPTSLSAHLACVGMNEADKTMLLHITELARSPFPLEFQFDVDRDGRALTKLGASVRFQPRDWTEAGTLKDVERLFYKTEGWGLADGRWRRLRETTFAKCATLGEKKVTLWCFPAFLKVRWRDGNGLDAKAYLMAGTI